MKKLILFLLLLFSVSELSAQVFRTVKFDTARTYKNGDFTFIPPFPKSTTRASTDSLKASVDSLRAQVDSLRAEMDSLGTRLDLLAAQLDAIEGRLDALEARIAVLETRQDDITADLAELDTKLATLQARFAEVASTFNQSQFDALNIGNSLSIKNGSNYYQLVLPNTGAVDTIASQAYAREQGGGGGGADSATVVGWFGGILGVRARSSDTTNTNGTLATDGQLYALMGGTLDHDTPLNDGSIWSGYFDLFFDFTTNATGVQIALTLPDAGYTVADISYDYWQVPATQDSAWVHPFDVDQEYVSDATASLSLTNSSLISYPTANVRVSFWVDNRNGEAGYLRLKWASINTQDVTLLKGSRLVAHRIY